MRILMVSAEAAPLVKVGGLADVVGALARELGRRGHEVRIALPLYGDLDRKRLDIRPLAKLPPLVVRSGASMHDVRWHVAGSGRGAVRTLLVESPLFARPGVYTDAQGRGFADSLARAALHAAAALQLPRLMDWPVDVIHAHDAAAAAALVLRRELWAGRTLPGPAAGVLTIHNLAHQEAHPTAAVAELGLPAALAAYPGLLEFHGGLNLMKGGILAAERLNTVSPTYARETTADPRFGCGLEGVLAGRGDHYRGILNGGEYETWDPRHDPALPAVFGPGDLEGKAACRAGLVAELGLDAAIDAPLCGFVGRLVDQKGVDLLLPVVDRLAGDGFTFAVLGTGDPRLEESMRAAAVRNRGRVAFVGTFDEGLAHRIYAGSDLFLMPSLFEPCGLSQMYALRYGTPPVVRRTGGLADTVVDAAGPDGTGFVFDDARPEALLATLRRAAQAFGDREAWARLQARGMACDFSWSRSAEAYEALYAEAVAEAQGRIERGR
ncbi:MAG TPA: glycogen synthase [Candidatus Krumholzibacteria bacterium]|nr:glycogen synthase [Candidatus Krumholzibacteria bacterium]